MFRNAITLGMIIMLVGITACKKRLSNEEIGMLNDAVEKKLSIAVETFGADKINATTRYCESKDKIITQAGTFFITCAVVADFYDPKHDEVVVSGNKTILPVSLYSRAENALHLLDEGWKFRKITILATAQNEELPHEPVVSKEHYLTN